MDEQMRLTRREAEDQIETIRESLRDHSKTGQAHYKHYNELAGVVRDLWDGYPLEDAKSSLAYADIPHEAKRQIAAILDQIDDRDDDLEARQANR